MMISKVNDCIKAFLFAFALVFFSGKLVSQVELISAGTGAAYTLSYPANTSGYVNGMTLTFKSHIANTGPATLNMNSHGPISIVNTANTALSAGDIKLGQVVTIIYDGTSFQMVTTSGNIITGSPISGSGTINFVPKWSGATSLTNSLIVDDGTNIGIGTSLPTHKFQLQSTISSGDTSGIVHIYSNNTGMSNALVAIGNSTGGVGAPSVYSRAYLAGYGNIKNTFATLDAFPVDYGVWGDGNSWGVVATNRLNSNFVALAGTVASSALRIVDGNQAVNRVLTSDISGNATWQTLPGGLDTWTRTAPNLFLNNIGDSVGIGTFVPTSKLHIVKTGGTSDALSVYHSGSGDAINGFNTGTGSAGYFQITNSSSIANVIYSTTNGSGATIFGNNTGIGRAAEFQINKSTNNDVTLAAYTNGTGRAGYFEASNTLNSSDALSVYHSGGGDAVNGYNLGTGGAGFFKISNSANTKNALYATSNGTGNVAVFESTNPTSALAVLMIKGGHILSSGIAPVIVLTVANGLTGVSLAGSTDVKGTIVATGTNSNVLNSVITVTFNKLYATAPKVVITPASPSAQSTTYYVTSSTENFVLNFLGGTASPGFNYIVIE